MAKSQKIVRQTNVRNTNGVGHQLEHSEVLDDNLLPDAREIEKLQKLDPFIMEWLKERAKKEQDFRHSAYGDRLNFVIETERANNRLNTMGLIFAFLIVCAGLWFSYCLLEKGHVVAGSIFGGATIFAGAGLFINNGKKKETNSANQE